jgi:phytanoyl-CoA dioxygenase PhyH
MKATLISPRLTSQEVEFYQREGYLLHHQAVFSRQKFEKLKNHFEELLDQWLADPRMRSPEHMDVPHFIHPSLFEWLLDDAVLNLVEPIIGPDIALWTSHFICKPPAIGKRVPWHEDSSYWKGMIDPMQVVTVWLAIDPSTPSNGCMRIIPRTHHHGFSEYNKINDPAVFDTEIKRGQFDESKAVDCVLRPNECSLHDGKLIHGSAANTGTMRRCGYTMRYIPTTVKVQSHMLDERGHQVYLARGRDRAGNQYGDSSKPNHAWLERHKDGFPIGH